MGLEAYVQDVASMDLADPYRPIAAKMVPRMLMRAADQTG